MSLSDDLSKIDSTIELVTRKIFNQYHDLNEERGKEESSKALEKSVDESLTVSTCKIYALLFIFQILPKIILLSSNGMKLNTHQINL